MNLLLDALLVPINVNAAKPTEKRIGLLSLLSSNSLFFFFGGGKYLVTFMN